MNFPKHIFKAYDIRGLVNGELSGELAYSLGRALIIFLKSKGHDFTGKKLVVGKDMRASSLMLQKELIAGIIDEGIDAVEVGLVSTPLFNFACAGYEEHIAGVMVTASHNPGEYNGFKITLGDGLPIGETNGMYELRDITEKIFANGQPARVDIAAVKGKIFSREVTADYLAKIYSLVDVQKLSPLKIVIDAGNGMAKVTFPELLKNLPIKVEFLFLEPDGNFPNHEANPIKIETLRALQEKVVESGADFGFALDGDADRIGLVDETGKAVDASFVGALLGLEVLKLHPNSLMLSNLLFSKIVPEVWQSAGAATQICRVGHAFVKKQMKEMNAQFAAELSLHVYYHDTYDLECPELSLLYFVQLISREHKKLSELVAPLKKYVHSGEVNYKVADKQAVMQKIEDTYKTQAKKIYHLDGLSMEFDWGWFNIRPSNTEPLLRLNLEGKTEAIMKEKFAEVENLIK